MTRVQEELNTVREKELKTRQVADKDSERVAT